MILMKSRKELEDILNREFTQREIHVHNVMIKYVDYTCIVVEGKIVYYKINDGYGRYEHTERNKRKQ